MIKIASILTHRALLAPNPKTTSVDACLGNENLVRQVDGSSMATPVAAGMACLALQCAIIKVKLIPFL